MRPNSYITTEAGLVTGNLFEVPSRWFLPAGLFQVSCDSDNMHYVGMNTDAVLGSAIGTSQQGAMGSAIGEFCERYCASHEPASRLVRASYSAMVAQHGAAAVLAPQECRLYADWQYAQPGFPYRRYADEVIAWVQGHDLRQGQPTWVPAYLVFMPHDVDRYDAGNRYALPTSTGVATGRTLAEAIQGGFLECAERHAFTSFWYRQRTAAPVPFYDAEAVVRAYPDQPWIQRLYANPQVRIRVYDLGSLGPVETVVVFLYYRYKNTERLSMGAASRFTKPEALIKAALEAYQGVEYGIMLDKNEQEWTTNLPGYTNVNDFHKHFLFYTRFPELQAQVPVLRRLREPATDEVQEYGGTARMRSMADVQQAGVSRLVAVELTTPDVQELGMRVVRVLAPGWAPITGLHDRPFLGAAVFEECPSLFTELPHPFP